MSSKPFYPDQLKSIAEQFGTPTYVYSESSVDQQIDKFLSAFGQYGVRLLYAMKANSHPWMLRTILAKGVGIDAVSPAEAILATRCGCVPSSIFYSPNNASLSELDWAAEQGFVVNLGELSRVEGFTRNHPGSDVCVRLNLNIGAGHHDHVVTGGEKSKFGILHTNLDKVIEIAARNNCRITGIHQHIGSGSTDPEPLAQGIIAIAETAKKLPDLKFVNMGGGFGVSYKSDQPALDLDHVADLVGPALHELRDSGIEVWFEPGRFLVAESGILLTRVNAVKQTTTRRFAGTDSGMNHLVRPSLYQSYHHIVNLTNGEAAPQPYDVVGNICETGDYFARDRPISEIREGDLLSILDAGAYSASMASLYNLRPLPAEIAILSNGTLLEISPRLTANELVDQILQSSGLSQ